MKQALFVALLLLPLSAAAQTAPPSSSRSEMQSVSTEVLEQLQAKMQFRAQVLDLNAQIAELQKQLAAKAPEPVVPAPKKD